MLQLGIMNLICLMDHILFHVFKVQEFEYIIKKHETIANKAPVQVQHMPQDYFWYSTGLRLLFVIYIIDLFRSSSKLTPIMFADDTDLFIFDSNIENAFKTMNEELRKVATWFKANKLSLSISKTKYSLLYSTRK